MTSLTVDQLRAMAEARITQMQEIIRKGEEILPIVSVMNDEAHYVVGLVGEFTAETRFLATRAAVRTFHGHTVIFSSDGWERHPDTNERTGREVLSVVVQQRGHPTATGLVCRYTRNPLVFEPLIVSDAVVAHGNYFDEEGRPN